MMYVRECMKSEFGSVQPNIQALIPGMKQMILNEKAASAAKENGAAGKDAGGSKSSSSSDSDDKK